MYWEKSRYLYWHLLIVVSGQFRNLKAFSIGIVFLIIENGRREKESSLYFWAWVSSYSVSSFSVALFWKWSSIFSIPPKLLYPEKRAKRVWSVHWEEQQSFFPFTVSLCSMSLSCGILILALGLLAFSIPILITASLLFYYCFLIRTCDINIWVPAVCITVLCPVGKS